MSPPVSPFKGSWTGELAARGARADGARSREPRPPLPSKPPLARTDAGGWRGDPELMIRDRKQKLLCCTNTEGVGDTISITNTHHLPFISVPELCLLLFVSSFKLH